MRTRIPKGRFSRMFKKVQSMPVLRDNVLICIFSYNMGISLEACIESIRENCEGFNKILIDDNSSDPRTKAIITKFRDSFVDVICNRDEKKGKRHGNLYANIETAISYAEESGYRYLFLVQDDMIFVRPLSDVVMREYSDILDSSEKVLQIDPRFLMRRNYEVLPALGAYRHSGLMSYSDVGLLDVVKYRASGWSLLEGERENGRGLAALGYRRYFPFTPIVMHAPFPVRYRNGKRKASLLLWARGSYRFRQMSEEEIRAMDSRNLEEVPIYRKFLSVEGMILARIPYLLSKDGKIFS